MPAAYAPSKEGLTLNQAAKALEIFLSDPRVIGLEITEFGPTRDPISQHVQKLIRLLLVC